jgi:hypothetical protein
MQSQAHAAKDLTTKITVFSMQIAQFTSTNRTGFTGGFAAWKTIRIVGALNQHNFACAIAASNALLGGQKYRMSLYDKGTRGFSSIRIVIYSMG